MEFKGLILCNKHIDSRLNNIAAFCYSGERQLREIEMAENVSVGILMEMLELRKRRTNDESLRKKYEELGVSILESYNGMCYTEEETRKLTRDFLEGKYMDCFLN